MKMRVLAAGLAAVLVTGGGATVAQRIITQKTRGVLPEKDDAAHADSRGETGLAPDPAVKVTLTAVPPARQAAPAGPSSALPPAEPTPAEPPLSLAADDRPTPPADAVEVIPTTKIAAEPPPITAEPASPIVEATAGEPAPTDAALKPATTAPADPATKADPVESVDAFVERNRKEAETAIASLTAEAANLKTRLVKVEAALTRWQAFSHALNPDQSAAQPVVSAPARPGWRRNSPTLSIEPPISTTIEGHVQPTTEPAAPAPATDLPVSPPVPPAGEPGDVPGTDPTPPPTPAPEPAALPAGPK